MLMADWTLQTPVAFMIFNRPRTTERVFREIAKARPPTLLVVSDGPRSNREEEAELVARARSIVEEVDWKCEVLTNFSRENLGCKKRVSTGLDWVFNNVEEAIVLEDDCVPVLSFFRYCEELLALYRNDARVAMISGANFQSNRARGSASYYFSRYGHIWGWATWRRAWSQYDVTASGWPSFREANGLERVLGGLPAELEYWRNIMDRVHCGGIDTWDYQWMLTTWIRDMLCIIPQRNLVSNIGWDADATHTRGHGNRLAHVRQCEMGFPLTHPTEVVCNREADTFTWETVFSSPSLAERIAIKLRGLTRRFRADV